MVGWWWYHPHIITSTTLYHHYLLCCQWLPAQPALNTHYRGNLFRNRHHHHHLFPFSFSSPSLSLWLLYLWIYLFTCWLSQLSLTRSHLSLSADLFGCRFNNYSALILPTPLTSHYRRLSLIHSHLSFSWWDSSSLPLLTSYSLSLKWASAAAVVTFLPKLPLELLLLLLQPLKSLLADRCDWLYSSSELTTYGAWFACFAAAVSGRTTTLHQLQQISTSIQRRLMCRLCARRRRRRRRGGRGCSGGDSLLLLVRVREKIHYFLLFTTPQKLSPSPTSCFRFCGCYGCCCCRCWQRCSSVQQPPPPLPLYGGSCSTAAAASATTAATAEEASQFAHYHHYRFWCTTVFGPASAAAVRQQQLSRVQKETSGRQHRRTERSWNRYLIS